MGIEKNNFINNDKKIKTPEEQLGDFFDKTKGVNFKRELSPKRYEEEKAEFIREGLDEEWTNTSHENKIDTVKKQDLQIEEMKAKIVELEKEAERLGIDIDFLGPLTEEALYEARFDPVTGLKNRRELFKKIGPQIKKLLGFKNENNPDNEAYLEKIKNSSEDFEDTDFFIMMSDISFLGLVNDLIGHNSGDILLQKISEKMQSVMKECFRHGGDELTGVFTVEREELLSMAKTAKREISILKDIPGLESSKLAPNIDMGFAKFSEAMKIYKELLNSEQAPQEMNKNVLRNFQNIWLAIAEKKMSLGKAKERITLLIDRANDDEELVGALQKAAYNINHEELEDLKKVFNNGGDINQAIDDFIKRKEIVKLDGAKQHEKKLTELILKHTNII